MHLPSGAVATGRTTIVTRSAWCDVAGHSGCSSMGPPWTLAHCVTGGAALFVKDQRAWRSAPGVHANDLEVFRRYTAGLESECASLAMGQCTMLMSTTLSDAVVLSVCCNPSMPLLILQPGPCECFFPTLVQG
jgi:hypothetical protein